MLSSHTRLFKIGRNKPRGNDRVSVAAPIRFHGGVAVMPASSLAVRHAAPGIGQDRCQQIMAEAFLKVRQ
jgi:hypothetical protein